MTEVLANTDMLIKMLENGIIPRLPEVSINEKFMDQYPDFVPVHGEMNDIVSIEYVGEEEVQCISIDDKDHLYITDGYIPTHNTSNIIFLKSTDDSMIETLSKMSGTRHKTYADGKTVTKDIKALVKSLSNEGKVSITLSTKEEPVIAYNDMAFISERNSIVFRAGDSPIWNRNETILPMSWRLFQNTIQQPGKKYSLMTIPTLSTAMDFDVRKNQPNFSKMLEKRMNQAYIAADAEKMYKDAYGYDDYDVEQLDPDTYADEIMDLICSTLNPDEVKNAVEQNISGNKKTENAESEYEEMFDYIFGNQAYKGKTKFTTETDAFDEFDYIEDNKDNEAAIQEAVEEQKAMELKRYAGKQVSRDMLVSKTGVNHGLDQAIIRVYKSIKDRMDNDKEYFVVKNGSLCGLDGSIYLKNLMSVEDQEAINEAIKSKDLRVYSDDEISKEDLEALGTYAVTDEFLRFLVTFPKAWPFADGDFELRMKNEIRDGVSTVEE